MHDCGTAESMVTVLDGIIVWGKMTTQKEQVNMCMVQHKTMHELFLADVTSGTVILELDQILERA